MLNTFSEKIISLAAVHQGNNMKPSEKSTTRLLSQMHLQMFAQLLWRQGETYRCNKAKKLAHTGPQFLATSPQDGDVGPTTHAVLCMVPVGSLGAQWWAFTQKGGYSMHTSRTSFHRSYMGLSINIFSILPVLTILPELRHDPAHQICLALFY